MRGKEPKARQVSISMAASWQVVEIIRAGGWRAADVRPLVRLNVSVVCADGSRMESGGTGSGRRAAYGDIFKPEYWQREADEAIRQALVNLKSVAGARRRDAGRARAGLVGRAVARGGRPRAGRRLPSQEDLGVQPA